MKKEENINCIFCKIINSEIPCDKIYEDKKLLAFLDIYPKSKGHILLIPKEHIIWMQEADNKTISEIFKKAKKIMLKMKESLKCDYIQIEIIGKDVPHFHIHLIPRKIKDNLHESKIIKYKKGEIEEIMKKLK